MSADSVEALMWWGVGAYLVVVIGTLGYGVWTAKPRQPVWNRKKIRWQ